MGFSMVFPCIFREFQQSPRLSSCDDEGIACLQPSAAVDGVMSVLERDKGLGIGSDWGSPARHGGTPKWMVFVMENPIIMDDN